MFLQIITPWWGAIDASTDWCEANYVVSPYIAEFVNTLSSLPLIYFGLFGLVMTHRWATTDRRFHLAFCILTSVGIGSTIFHGTLRRSAQMFDEIPMLISNVVFLYYFLENARVRKYRWSKVLCSSVVSVIILLYVLTKNYAFFITVTTITELAVLGVTIVTIACTDTPTPANRLFTWFVALYGVGFFLWMLDNQYCAVVAHWYLHAWWHLLAGFGTYCYILFFLTLRRHTFGEATKIAWCYGMPYVRRAQID